MNVSVSAAKAAHYGPDPQDHIWTGHAGPVLPGRASSHLWVSWCSSLPTRTWIFVWSCSSEDVIKGLFFLAVSSPAARSRTPSESSWLRRNLRTRQIKWGSCRIWMLPLSQNILNLIGNLTKASEMMPVFLSCFKKFLFAKWLNLPRN